MFLRPGTAHLPPGKIAPDRHAVLGERAGLVHAENGCRTQGLDGRYLPGEHIFLRDPPRTKGEEHGQDNGELFRQDCHGKRDPGKEPFEPVVPGKTVDNNDDYTQEKADNRDGPDNRCDLRFQPGIAPLDGLQDSADLSHLGPGPGSPDLCKSLALHNERPGEDRGLVVATGPVSGHPLAPGYFPDRDRFPGQEGFIHHDVIGKQENAVSRHTVAFRKDEHVAADDLAAGDPFLFAVPDNERPRAGEVPQRLQRPLGLLLLVDRYADDEDDKTHQHQALGEVAEDKIDQAACDQQDEHRLVDDFKNNPEDAALFRFGEFVVSFGPEFFGRFPAGQAGNRIDIEKRHGPAILLIIEIHRRHDKMVTGGCRVRSAPVYTAVFPAEIDHPAGSRGHIPGNSPLSVR